MVGFGVWGWGGLGLDMRRSLMLLRDRVGLLELAWASGTQTLNHTVAGSNLGSKIWANSAFQV